MTCVFSNAAPPRCYFTYRVGYVICDVSLGPDEAQKEMEASMPVGIIAAHHVLLSSLWITTRLVDATKIFD